MIYQMTKSTMTREQLLEIIETDHVQCGDAAAGKGATS